MKHTELNLVKWVDSNCPPIDLNARPIDVLELVSEIKSLRTQKDKLIEALKAASASLCTYGSHPLIESQIQKALKEAE